MYLSKFEEKMLNGEFGEVKARALKVIVRVGEALGAEELLRVSHVHVSGVSYFTIGDAGLEFLREASKGRVEVYTTCNPTGLDFDLWCKIGFSKLEFEKQREIVSLLEKMGVETTCTCTPYYIRKPREGECIAWGESNAVLYANSVLGARSNRLGGPLTVMAALTGRVPRVGLYLDEERKPTVIVSPLKTPRNEYEWGRFGYELGKTVKRGVPYVEVKPRSEESLRSFLAGIGTSSSIGLTLIKDLSLEARKLSEKELSTLERVTVEFKPESVIGDFDAVIVGCPHYTVNELEKLKVLAGKYSGRVKVPFYVLISRGAYREALNNGLIRELEGKGFTVLKGTCLIVSKIKHEKILTNSSKAAYYLKSFQKLKVELAPLREILEAVFRSGEVRV